MRKECSVAAVRNGETQNTKIGDQQYEMVRWEDFLGDVEVVYRSDARLYPSAYFLKRIKTITHKWKERTPSTSNNPSHTDMNSLKPPFASSRHWGRWATWYRLYARLRTHQHPSWSDPGIEFPKSSELPLYTIHQYSRDFLIPQSHSTCITY